MPVDMEALTNFLAEAIAWLESGNPEDCNSQERLRELKVYQIRAATFSIESGGAPLSVAWFKAIQEQYPEVWPTTGF